MKPLPYKHYFIVKNGKFVWEDPLMFQLKRKILEGKKGYAIIEGEENRSTPNQLAYYFGGIIRKECMTSECFAGWREAEIHNYLLLKVRGTMRRVRLHDGSSSLVEMPADFSLIMHSILEMSKYIEEVISYLNTELEIYPKPAEHYKYNKFRIDPKIYKHEEETSDTI